MRKSARLKSVLLALLFVLAIGVTYAGWREGRKGILTTSFLDVGEGDAIFIEAPSGVQVLIDGGPDTGIVRQLSRMMPWWDREIDLIVATEPDAPHSGGLIDVLERYTIGTIAQSNVSDTSPAWSAFEKKAGELAARGTRIVTARRGQRIDLGDDAYLEILMPDRSAPDVAPDEGCVVMRLVYGKTSFMLPCDAPKGVEQYLTMLDGIHLRSDVLKVGHGGSSKSSSPIFIGYVAPAYAVISRGCDKKSPPPSANTIATFEKFGVTTLDTCVDGTVTFVSDGETISLKK
ncbi:MAG: hypothetical protein RLZZ416_31 [Candidatus Parcubacteria bacterium]|jgi:competence protein ComEC